MSTPRQGGALGDELANLGIIVLIAAAVLAVRARPLLSFPGEAPYSSHHDHLAGDLGIRAMDSAATVF